VKWLLLLGLLGSLGLLLARMAQAAEVPKAGQSAPAFSLPDQAGKLHKLSDYSGKWLVLYFYPKDDTPGCTQEACAFRDDLHILTSLGAEVVGVSVDDSSSHAEFAKKYHLPFPLLADKSSEVAAQYGVLLNFGLFKMAKRYTFLIDPQGKISKVYDKVETSRHSAEIIADLKLLSSLKKP
jgi:peroxiredoxin Q/BCP